MKGKGVRLWHFGFHKKNAFPPSCVILPIFTQSIGFINESELQHPVIFSKKENKRDTPSKKREELYKPKPKPKQFKQKIEKLNPVTLGQKPDHNDDRFKSIVCVCSHLFEGCNRLLTFPGNFRLLKTLLGTFIIQNGSRQLFVDRRS
jgi:hypothetical protein